MKGALRAFAHRPWELVEREKRRFVAERYRAGGAAASWAAAQRLKARWRALHPEGSPPRMRDEDLAALVALKAKLMRAVHGLGR